MAAHNGPAAHMTRCSRVAGKPALLLMDEASQAGRVLLRALVHFQPHPGHLTELSRY